MTVEERRRRRFSEEFRKEQVRLIEIEELTIADVSRLYQVKRASIKRWLAKYSTKELPSQIIIQTQAEVNRIKELERQSTHLKKVIGEQQLELLYLRECLALAKERVGEDFEKKIKRKWSSA
jgi:transposase-like protein